MALQPSDSVLGQRLATVLKFNLRISHTHWLAGNPSPIFALAPNIARLWPECWSAARLKRPGNEAQAIADSLNRLFE